MLQGLAGLLTLLTGLLLLLWGCHLFCLLLRLLLLVLLLTVANTWVVWLICTGQLLSVWQLLSAGILLLQRQQQQP
jgi:hypothetical protein